MKINWLVVLSFLVIVACSDDGRVAEMPAIYDVDPEFEPYVQEFIIEAEKRGQTFDFRETGLSIKFSEFPLTNANGRCFLGQYRIEIDKLDWFSFSELFRSYLLFHELGHCALNRRHRNDKFSDGSWKSVLKGDPFVEFDARKPVPYFGFRKDYYIDELFDESMPTPDWGDLTFDFDIPLEREEVSQLTPNVSRLNERLSGITDDYEVEVEFDFIDQRGIWTTLEWGEVGANYYIQIIPDFGYYIGVKDDGFNNILHYRQDTDRANGRAIDNITIRQRDGLELIFVNQEFIFHLDRQNQLDYVALSALEDDQVVNNFRINGLKISTIQ